MSTRSRAKRAVRWALACGLLLALVAGQALALGLGRIEVKSRAGEPLLAEIEVISSDPAELDQLRARLASPDTFRRIGLPAPDAVLSGLEFAVALDARGNPVIRVTTREPVTQPALTFLVEVDWGQGRLVREYSALVDAPEAVAAPAQMAVEAPAAAPADTIVRAPEPAAAPQADADAAAASGTAADDAAGPGPVATAPQPVPAPPVAPQMPPAPEPAGALPGEYGPVQAGETLGEIAAQLTGDGISRDQALVALFRANPQAFISNNLNLVRQGAVLRIPDRDEIAGLDRGEARALVREQVAAWREMIRVAPQPEAMTADAGDAAAAPAEGAAAPGAGDARLEIVPPSAGDGRQAGIRSGIQAGGEGEMLRQELQNELLESRETLAARDAEVAELKARVADLERLQAQQAQLITMKDSELAAAQERLATASDAATGAPAQAGQPAAGAGPWIWGGLGLLLVALVAVLLGRRGHRPGPRPRFGTVPPGEAAVAPGPAPAVAAAPDPVPAPAQPSAPAPSEAPPPAAVPAWHAGARSAAPAEPDPAPAPPAPDPADAALVASLNPAPGGAERIELARAYLDLGDVETARELLREVAEGGDPAVRAEAARLLDGIA